MSTFQKAVQAIVDGVPEWQENFQEYNGKKPTKAQLRAALEESYSQIDDHLVDGMEAIGGVVVADLVKEVYKEAIKIIFMRKKKV